MLAKFFEIKSKKISVCIAFVVNELIYESFSKSQEWKLFTGIRSDKLVYRYRNAGRFPLNLVFCLAPNYMLPEMLSSL